MARGDAVAQPYQFDPESDPEGEAAEEVQPLRLRQHFSEWLVCLNNVCLFYVLLQLLQHVIKKKMKLNHCLFCCSVAGTEYRH